MYLSEKPNRSSHPPLLGTSLFGLLGRRHSFIAISIHSMYICTLVHVPCIFPSHSRYVYLLYDCKIHPRNSQYYLRAFLCKHKIINLEKKGETARRKECSTFIIGDLLFGLGKKENDGRYYLQGNRKVRTIRFS